MEPKSYDTAPSVPGSQNPAEGCTGTAFTQLSLKSLGIPDDGYLMVIVYDSDRRLLENFPFAILPAFVRAGDISPDDQHLIAVGFKGSASGFPLISFHSFPEFPFESIKVESPPPTPTQPRLVYGVVEVSLWTRK